MGSGSPSKRLRLDDHAPDVARDQKFVNLRAAGIVDKDIGRRADAEDHGLAEATAWRSVVEAHALLRYIRSLHFPKNWTWKGSARARGGVVPLCEPQAVVLFANHNPVSQESSDFPTKHQYLARVNVFLTSLRTQDRTMLVNRASA